MNSLGEYVDQCSHITRTSRVNTVKPPLNHICQCVMGLFLVLFRDFFPNFLMPFLSCFSLTPDSWFPHFKLQTGYIKFAFLRVFMESIMTISFLWFNMLLKNMFFCIFSTFHHCLLSRGKPILKLFYTKLSGFWNSIHFIVLETFHCPSWPFCFPQI